MGKDIITALTLFRLERGLLGPQIPPKKDYCSLLWEFWVNFLKFGNFSLNLMENHVKRFLQLATMITWLDNDWWEVIVNLTKIALKWPQHSSQLLNFNKNSIFGNFLLNTFWLIYPLYCVPLFLCMTPLWSENTDFWQFLYVSVNSNPGHLPGQFFWWANPPPPSKKEFITPTPLVYKNELKPHPWEHFNQLFTIKTWKNETEIM